MLELKEFLAIFDVLVNEFRIINDHFEANVHSTIEDYDNIFHRWRQDIQRRFRQVVIGHRWATNQRPILQNTLFFIVRYGNTYNCEVKYLFNPQFRQEFGTLLREALDALSEILFRFQVFVITYKADHPTLDHHEFEQEFLEWKKTLYKQADVYAVDFLWAEEMATEEENPKSHTVELTLSQKDNVTFFVQYDLDNPPPLIKEIQIEQDIS
ncbi:MAG: hypothetical protein N2314_07605 [Brevinematales bacterium]|nr:hypothetical protein [Brevinematales bacterium]